MQDQQVEVVPGAHAVARVAGAVVLVAHRGAGRPAADSPAVRALVALAELVHEAATRQPEGPGATIAREATRWLMADLERNGAAGSADFGILSAAEPGRVAIFLHGAVTAVVAGETTEYLRGRDAAFTVDRTAALPSRAVGLFVDDPAADPEDDTARPRLPATRGIGRLVEGIAEAGGAIVWGSGVRRAAAASGPARSSGVILDKGTARIPSAQLAGPAPDVPQIAAAGPGTAKMPVDATENTESVPRGGPAEPVTGSTGGTGKGHGITSAPGPTAAGAEDAAPRSADVPDGGGDREVLAGPDVSPGAVHGPGSEERDPVTARPAGDSGIVAPGTGIEAVSENAVQDAAVTPADAEVADLPAADGSGAGDLPVAEAEEAVTAAGSVVPTGGGIEEAAVAAGPTAPIGRGVEGAGGAAAPKVSAGGDAEEAGGAVGFAVSAGGGVEEVAVVAESAAPVRGGAEEVGVAAGPATPATGGTEAATVAAARDDGVSPGGRSAPDDPSAAVTPPGPANPAVGNDRDRAGEPSTNIDPHHAQTEISDRQRLRANPPEAEDGTADARPNRPDSPSSPRHPTPCVDIPLPQHGPADRPRQGPPERGTPPPDPELRRRTEATAKGFALTVKVRGFKCARAHPTDPRSAFCSVCGMPVDQLQPLIEVVRPPLGVLVLDDGSTHLLETDSVLGRDPEKSEPVRRGLTPLQITDNSGGMSRAHAELLLVEWDVTLVDRGSTNGTRTRPPGVREWVRVPPHQPVVLVPGTEILIGNRVLRFESAAPPPFGL